MFLFRCAADAPQPRLSGDHLPHHAQEPRVRRRSRKERRRKINSAAGVKR